METKTIAIGVMVAAGIGGLIYYLIRKAKPVPTGYICPYCEATFDTHEELEAHILFAHPGKRIPIDILWE
ncbi:unnamed protein product [marine sediment metagenome]|uniref:C2H2-type domain-containing protein n=1 Tax=marine sediment metagenome TaxID=412755 RepID=X1KCA7_9ZZZZ